MVAPLFIASEADLESKLRLSAVPATATDTHAIIDEGILHARVEFYSELGEVRVAALVAEAYSETASTEAGILRMLANLTEVMIVKCYLMVNLPTMFMDASGDANKVWNEEAPLRERGSMDVADELLACRNKIAENMLVLAANDTDECQDIQVFDGTPDCQTSFPENTPRIGMSLKGPSGVNPPAED
jgi:hypothetical protein